MGTPLQTAFFNLSLTLAALVFNLALCLLLSLSSERKKKSNNRNFLMFSYAMLIGIVFTCADEALRRLHVINIHPVPGMALYLLSLLANISLTFFFSLYIQSLFKGRSRLWMSLVLANKILMCLAVLMVVVCFLAKLPELKGEYGVYKIPEWLRFTLAYVFELYYLAYALVLLIFYRKNLNRRGNITAMSAFAVTIGAIIIEVFNPTHVLINYFGAVLGLFVFYIGSETPDYKNLKQTLKELEAAKLQADEANRTKSDFLANMSHEIRTPINAVIGMNEMIIRESREPKIVEYARGIEGSGRNLLAIVNDILDISKIEAGRMELEIVQYKFSTLLNDVVTMIGFKADEKKLTFDVDIDKTMPDNLYGDPDRIRQIFVNLLNNAVKYTDNGGIELKIRYEMSGKNLTLMADVTDSGIGIKQEDLSKLFRKFDRVDTERNKTIEGTGLGLSIVQNLLKLMNGEITLDSVYGRGSTFHIKFPQVVANDEQIGDYQRNYEDINNGKDAYKVSFHAPDASLLIVDDTPVNLIVAKGLLKSTQIKIDTAGSGKEALIKTAHTAYDLILMDIRMPVMSGTETLHFIRQQEDGMNLDTPVICLTADAISGAREHYLADGFSDYITKPIESSALESTLRKYLPQEKILM